MTKATKEFVDQTGRRKVKGNMDIELAVDAMEIAGSIDHMVLFSGDGDFRSLVEAMQRRGVRVTVVSTISTQPPMVADELRRQADVFLDIVELQPKIGRDPAERAARARAARTARAAYAAIPATPRRAAAGGRWCSDDDDDFEDELSDLPHFRGKTVPTFRKMFKAPRCPTRPANPAVTARCAHDSKHFEMIGAAASPTGSTRRLPPSVDDAAASDRGLGSRLAGEPTAQAGRLPATTPAISSTKRSSASVSPAAAMRRVRTTG